MRLKHTFLLLSVSLLILCCKSEKKTEQVEIELSAAEKIAQAHGFKKWDEVNKINFTFSIVRGDSEYSRQWEWHPKTNDIVCISGNDTISYNRSSMDSLSKNTDRGFINDKYWMLVPFQMMWDEGLTISEPVREVSPINKKELNKITLTYGSDGGYTPGDAYDIFYNENYLIEEWIFRKSNQPEPSLVSTFESYQDFNGILIATEHKRPNEDWNLKFKDITVSLSD